MRENRPQTLNRKSSLMVQVLERNNLIQALKQVTRNKGAAGIDGMQIDGKRKIISILYKYGLLTNMA